LLQGSQRNLNSSQFYGSLCDRSLSAGNKNPGYPPTEESYFFGILICMQQDTDFNALFQQAVKAIDAGDENGLKELLDAYPELAPRRLDKPGKWLLDAIPEALKGFFKEPYLLWFVAEDPDRNKVLSPNIARIAAMIIEKAKMERSNFRKQIDYALKLVSKSGIAHTCGVQIALLDVLIDAGAEKKRRQRQRAGKWPF
jgi:hypothetical protein